MLIQELTTRESLALLARARVGRLACAQGAQPYVVPVHFAYHERALYGFATVGQKIEWMRANPLVCVEVDEVAGQEEWASVVVLGRYEELPDTAEWQGAREVAHQLLEKTPMWWEPAYVQSIPGGPPHPLVPVFYRILVRHVTGRRATPRGGGVA